MVCKPYYITYKNYLKKDLSSLNINVSGQNSSRNEGKVVNKIPNLSQTEGRYGNSEQLEQEGER